MNRTFKRLDESHRSDHKSGRRCWHLFLLGLLGLATPLTSVAADTASLPIADVHVHYSHDSVAQTPPARVIELMRSANVKFALVSSSDDNGTQLLSELAPDIIVPGLRPYRRRGELNSWYQDDAALAYVEQLLGNNRYATIGEFHLFGETADLPIPRRIVELAVEHNLILHAHSDKDAIERLLAQNETVKVIWAHSGFDGPEVIAAMLGRHDRLYADLAFRSEVGGSGSLSADWIALFKAYPDRMMLGTDTYTPERMYFLPEHASAARRWLTSLPPELAEKVAWKNAHDLIMPVWQKNQQRVTGRVNRHATNDCTADGAAAHWQQDGLTTVLTTAESMTVSEAFDAMIRVCSHDPAAVSLSDITINIDAVMQAHGHGMNYTPDVRAVSTSEHMAEFRVEGLVLHMPGEWEWQVTIKDRGASQTLLQSFELR